MLGASNSSQAPGLTFPARIPRWISDVICGLPATSFSHCFCIQVDQLSHMQTWQTTFDGLLIQLHIA